MNFGLQINRRFTQWTILAFLAIVWGSSFILMKKGLVAFSGIEVAALRVFIVFISMLPFIFRHFKKIPGSSWKILILSGIIGNGIPAFLFAFAQTKIDSSLAGILNALTPLFTLIVGMLFFRFKAGFIPISGVILGLAGAIGIVLANTKNSIEVNLFYSSLIIIATILYAINTNIIKTYLHHITALDITGFAFLFIGAVSTVYLFGFSDVIRQVKESEVALLSLFYVGILAILGTAISLIIYNNFLKHTSVIVASSVTYLIPIVAIGWGILDGEVFKPIFLLWIALILIGVYLVNFKRK